MVRRILAAQLAAAIALAGVPAEAASPESPYPTDPDQLPPDERGPLTPVDDTQTELVLPPVSAALNARRLAAAGRDAEAAAALEALAAQLGDLRFLYHAGLARGRAGDHAFAARLLALWLERSPGASEAARAYVASKLAAERAALVWVPIDLVEGPGGTPQPIPAEQRVAARIAVERLSPHGTPVPGVQWDEPTPFGGSLGLDPGQWRLRIEVPGYTPVAHVGTATPNVRWQVFVQRRQVAVDLRFSPPKALRAAKLVLRSTDNPTLTALERRLDGPTQTLVLPIGAYHVDVLARRHEAAQDFVIGPEPGPVDVVLKPRSGTGLDEKLTLDKKPLIAVLSLFAIDFYTGVGLLLGAINVESKTKERDDTAREDAGVDPDSTAPLDPAAYDAVEAAFPTAEYHRRLALGSNLNASGVVVAMSGLGVMLSLLPVMLRKTKRQLMIPLGVGAVTLASGASWLAVTVRDQRSMLEPATIDHRTDRHAFARLVGPRLAAGMLTGVGIGMVAFPVGYLIGRAAAKRRASRKALRVDVAPLAAPGQAGLVLGGRF